MATLLIVDDEPTICWGLSRLGQSLGHEVLTASNAEQGIETAKQRPPDAVLLDVRLPGMDGLAAIEHLRPLIGDAPIIVMTAFGDLRTAVEAVRRGAFEYLVKPFDLSQAERAIVRALDRVEQPALESPSPRVEGFVGSTPTMQQAFKRIALAAASDACVLLCGESGAGKELAARAIHRNSHRATGPFVAVNVASLSPALAESELFGHVRGAFTGAEATRFGLLSQADGGTLFLDELGDIPAATQVKLLRALEHGEVLPVGGNQPLKTNFRVVSATNRDLLSMVQDGTFRHDLYFRLSAFRIDLPPLRERREDIARLAEYFLDTLAQHGVAKATLSAAALADLQARPWYGNVRELRNTIEHAMILARGGPILPEHLPPPAPAGFSAGATASEPKSADPQLLAELVRRWAEDRLKTSGGTAGLYDELLSLIEPPLFRASLAANHDQCAAAARRLGLHRTTLRRKLDQYGIGGKDEE